MPGHIKEIIKNKKYLIVVEAGKHPATGRRRRIKRIFEGSERQANKEKTRLELEVAQGKHIDPTKLPLRDYLNHWLKTYVVQLAPKTQHRYKEVIETRINPLIGGILLTELRPVHIKDLYRLVIEQGRLDNRDKPLSQGSLTYVQRVIHKALNCAVEDELIQHNPASAITVPKVPRDIDDEDDEPNVRVLTGEQVDIMLEAAKNTHYYTMLFVDVRTGFRRGELLGLRWEDVDFKQGTISVRQAVSYTKELGVHIKKRLKNKKSRRTIDVSKEVLAVLKQHKKDQAELKLMYRQEYEDNDLIFCQPNGKPMHPDTPSSWFPEFLESIGLPRLNLHCLRHTHASLLLQAGVDIKVISERLGHSSIRITYDIYSHLMPGMQKEAIDKLEEVLKK